MFIAAEPREGGQPYARAAEGAHALRKPLPAGRAGRAARSPQYVPLQIELTVCVDPDYFQADVKQALLQALGSGMHAERAAGLLLSRQLLASAQTVYLSPIYAAARKVAGVTSVTASVFQPQGVNDDQLPDQRAKFLSGRCRSRSMDNDPSYPNHGQLTLVMQGGK